MYRCGAGQPLVSALTTGGTTLTLSSPTCITEPHQGGHWQYVGSFS